MKCEIQLLLQLVSALHWKKNDLCIDVYHKQSLWNEIS